MSGNNNVVAWPARKGFIGKIASGSRWGGAAAIVLGGSAIMLVGFAMVSALNFAYNLTMARMLGPAAFGHLAAIGTLLMLVSAIPLAFQIVCAKFVARNPLLANKATVYRNLLRKGWLVGLALGALLMASSVPVAQLLRLPSALFVTVLGLGIAFYIPLGVHRGAMQGLCSFRSLAGNLVLESGIKFGLAVALVMAGFGVLGAVGAIAGSVIAAYVISHVPLPRSEPDSGLQPASFREGTQATVFFVGQVIINNIDILLVKIYFPPGEAGLYAAVALVGRVLYFASWSVVSAMFPVSAAATDEAESRKTVLPPFLLVLGISAAFAVFLAFFSESVVEILFGHGFIEAEGLLSLYAVATGLYALSVVLISYEMSRKVANTGWLQLLFGMGIIGGIALFHDNLQQVILVQIVLMAVLLGLVCIPFLRSANAPPDSLQEAA